MIEKEGFPPLSKRERVMMIVIALLLLILSLLLQGGYSRPISLETQGIDFQNTLHSAAALGSLTLFMAIHRALQTTGFTLGRSFLSTDTWLSIGVVAVTAVWTALVFISGIATGDKPCANLLSTPCLSRLSFVPWLLLVLCIAWIIWFADAYIHQEARRGSSVRIGLWQMNVEEGPYAWKESLAPWFLWLIYAAQLFCISATAYGAVRTGEFTIAILNVVGFGLVLTSAGGRNSYCSSPVRYRGNNIRVPLTTTYNAKTLYILPSACYGFDAIWSPKLAAEHAAMDERVPRWFGGLHDRNSTTWSAYACSVVTKEIVNDHSKRATRITDAELEALARWIYCPDDDDNEGGTQLRVERRIRCDRVPGVHLIGRELMLALMATEYLVYALRYRLPAELREKYPLLRSVLFDGAEKKLESDQVAVGFGSPGRLGYQDAVRYVYKVFHLPVEDAALNPAGTPPGHSKALGRDTTEMEDYVDRLWDLSRTAETTTFGALVLFSGIWYLEMGNTNGFHIYPVQPKNDSHQGDLTTWQIIWRQAWYTVIMAQFVTMSPTVISAFLGGVLQK